MLRNAKEKAEILLGNVMEKAKILYWKSDGRGKDLILGNVMEKARILLGNAKEKARIIHWKMYFCKRWMLESLTKNPSQEIQETELGSCEDAACWKSKVGC